MTDVVSFNPRTGETIAVAAMETDPDRVDAACEAALAAAPLLLAMGRRGRAALLQALADALEARRSDIVSSADRETALGETRLNGELTRTCFQLRLFAEVLHEGSYLEATIDHAGDSPMGPRPDLRRMLVALGPVAVFGASNFPLAFSVPGGDTASALAAGCPVVIKAHGSHPATSQLCFEVMAAAATEAGAPAATLALVHGLRAGATLVAHPAIRAVGFTGSVSGGKALVEIIESRSDPIPFFGELASLNPLVVTPAAAAQRGTDIAAGVVASFTLGAGQFCTKPGLIFVPTGVDGDHLIETMATAVTALDAQVLLNANIADSYVRGGDELAAVDGVEEVAHGAAPRPTGTVEQGGQGGGAWVTPRLLSTTARALRAEVTEECFGPLAVVARYDDEADLLHALDKLPASLTATVHRGAGEVDLPGLVVDRLANKAGRFLFDAYPTGVAVSWAQHHGGPWPSTNSQHTSVGTSAIRRFLRPVTYQAAPTELLPAELRDGPVSIPRRVDGVLTLPTS